jgi:hypothetical protein
MKKLIVVFLLLCSAYSWGGEKKSVKDEARKEAAEDICFAYSEYYIACNNYPNACLSGYSTDSPCFSFDRKKQITLQRLLTLQDRYVKRFGSEFAVFPPQSSSGPTLCR